ncbi:MAG TPA: 3-phosphoshikimate 1-carboxyvinyltransferase [Dehalococcoidia bacterium]|nr:3-phosphoshikimate 1-carboxyvinyltransferase [Dehalococcoidia bacterium]
MRVSISKSDLSGNVTAPSSKSYTIRGLMCAALARGESIIMNPLGSDDTGAALSVLGQLGIRTKQEENFWRVRGGSFHRSDGDLFCAESATTLRFMTAIAALVPGQHCLTAGPSLSARPVLPLIEALKRLGVTCSCRGEVPPVIIRGGSLRGGETELPGDISSQFLSALLLAAPFSEKGMTIRLTSPLRSAPYVMMTLDCMQWFGISVAFADTLDAFEVARQAYKPTTFRVEGDWSSASYLVALGALAGEVEVENLTGESLQGDRVILDFLQEMGASVTTGNNSITVRKSGLRAITADLSNCIDLLPTMAVLAAAAEGISRFTGIERARIKESNRVAAMREGLERMGIVFIEETDRISITGGSPHAAIINSKDDHRIAMAFGLLGTVAGDTIIEGAECVSKTYPQFWKDLAALGGKVTIDGK